VFVILKSQFAFIMRNVSKSVLFSAERDINVGEKIIADKES
jgi:hypothetical protein